MLKWAWLLSAILFFASVNVFAQQSGGGDNTGLRNACEVSGGTFTGSEGGNWACCWSDWGCYGCVDGNCKIKCTTKRCRKANGMTRVDSGLQSVKGLAPEGMKAPIAPNPPVQPKMDVHPAGDKMSQ